jgi:hypothetical protein
MAPNLAKSTLVLIHDMIDSGELTVSQMTEATGCRKRAIIKTRSNPRIFGTRISSTKAGRPESITLAMLEILGDNLLLEKYTFFTPPENV